MKPLIILLLCVTLSATGLIAQTPISQDNLLRDYQTAELNYEEGNLSVSKRQFTKLEQKFEDIKLSSQCAFRAAQCAAELRRPDAVRLFIRFKENYPEDLRSNTIYLFIGNFFFGSAEYLEAAKYYEKQDVSNLGAEQKPEFHFNYAYSLFTQKKFDEALNQFSEINEYAQPWHEKASYYRASIFLRERKYEESLKAIEKAEDSEFKEEVPFIKMTALYNLERYEDLIDYSKKIENRSYAHKEECNLLQADAFYFLEKYEKATVAYNSYFESAGSGDLEVLYRAGFSAHRSGLFLESTEYFKKVAVKDDSLGTYASYYLGVGYLKIKNYKFAATAFQQVYASDIDLPVAPQALFLSAELSFRENDFSEAIRLFENYLKKYPKGKNSTEASELLTESYLSTHEYDRALNFIKSLPNRTDRIKKAFQKLSYYEGARLFNSGEVEKAITMLNAATNNDYDSDITKNAYFLKAESYSKKEEWSSAVSHYAAVFNRAEREEEVFLKSRYGIGYAYFNQSEYSKAEGHFNYFLNNKKDFINNAWYGDATVRLADCFYVQKQNEAAIKYYNKALEMPGVEKAYCLFQLGIIHSFKAEYDKAQSYFSLVIDNYPNSVYFNKARLQLAQSFFDNSKYERSISIFSEIIEQRKDYPIVPAALEKRALAHKNLNNYEAAKKDFIRILQEFSQSKIASRALYGLQEVLAQTGETDQFDQYLEDYKLANPGDSLLVEIEFDALKSLFFSGKNDAVLRKYQNYKKQYPQSANLTEATYYAAQSAERTDQTEKAIAYYNKVSSDPSQRYYLKANEKLADVYFETDSFASALELYKLVATRTIKSRTKSEALAGVAKTLYQMNLKDSALYWSDALLNFKGARSIEVSEIRLLKGQIYKETGRYDDAIDVLLAVSMDYKNELGAKARYLMAEALYEKGNYKESLEILYNYSSDFGEYDYWLGKAFLLIAENFIELNEDFQAKKTLESVINNSKNQEIIKIANEKLEEIKLKEESANVEE